MQLPLRRRFRHGSNKAHRPVRTRKLRAEFLEPRDLLAVTGTLVGGVLTLTGTTGDDLILVAASKNAGEINYGDGTGIGSNLVSGVTQVVIDSLDGDDTVGFFLPKENIRPPANGVSIVGGVGNDRLQFGGGTSTLLPAGSYTPAGPDGGTLSYTTNLNETLNLSFVGFEIVEEMANAVDLVAHASSSDDQIVITPGPTLGKNNGLSQGPVMVDGGDRDDHGALATVSSFANWTKTGALNILNSTDGVTIPEAAQMVEIPNSSQIIPQDQMELLLGLLPGSLDPEPVPTNPTLTNVGASAIYQDVTVAAGDVLTFSYEYLTESSSLDNSFINRFYPDVAFVTVSGGGLNQVLIQERAADLTSSATHFLNGSFYRRTSGTKTGSITFPIDGTFRIGFGTTQAGSFFYDSGLLIDDVQLNGTQIPDGDFETAVSITENSDGWKFIEQAVNYIHLNSFNAAATKDILAIGVDNSYSSTAFDAIDSVATALGLTVEFANDAEIATVDFTDYRLLYVPSNDSNVGGGIEASEQDALTLRRAEIQQYVRDGGGVFALTDASSGAAAGPYSWLEIPDRFVIDDNVPDSDLYKTQAAINAGFTISDGELSQGTPYHNVFTGPAGFNGLTPFVYDSGFDRRSTTAADKIDDRIVTLGQASLDLGGDGGDTILLDLGQNFEFRIGRKNLVTVDAGDGNDSVRVHGNGDTLGKLLVGVHIAANDGRDLLLIDDRSTTSDTAAILSPGGISGITGAPLSWSKAETVSFSNGGGFANTIDFDFSANIDVQNLILNGNTGNDAFGSVTRIVPPSNYSLQIHGNSGGQDIAHFALLNSVGTAIVDAAQGKVLAQGGKSFTFNGLEQINVDQAAGTTIVRPGELYVRGSSAPEIYTFYRGTTANDVMLRTREGVRFTTIGPFRPTGKILVDGLGGNDFIEMNSTLGNRPVVFSGGLGRDTLLGGGGNDLLIGGLGDDRLTGNGGADTLWGDLTTGPNPRLGNSGDGNDVLNGDAGNDILISGGGNDIVFGGTGDDYILGGMGNDRLYGNDGNDLLRADAGNDFLDGGNQSDILLGGDGQDILNGGSQRDLVLAGDGSDQILDTDVDEDILVSERTIYDIDNGSNTLRGTYDDSVTLILTEWLQLTTLAVRTNNIRSGGGLNASHRLSTANNSVLLDQGVDTISVSSGSADWLITRNIDRKIGTTAADIIDLV